MGKIIYKGKIQGEGATNIEIFANNIDESQLGDKTEQGYKIQPKVIEGEFGEKTYQFKVPLGLSSNDIVQSTGSQTDKVMSQKAVTDNYNYLHGQMVLKSDIVQEGGQSTTKIMSQQAVTNRKADTDQIRNPQIKRTTSGLYHYKSDNYNYSTNIPTSIECGVIQIAPYDGNLAEIVVAMTEAQYYGVWYGIGRGMKDNQDNIQYRKLAEQKDLDSLNTSLTSKFNDLNIGISNAYFAKKNIVQETGTNTNKLMSQKAVTTELNTLSSRIDNIDEEIKDSFIAKTDIVQELGENEDKVMSQKAVTDSYQVKTKILTQEEYNELPGHLSNTIYLVNNNEKYKVFLGDIELGESKPIIVGAKSIIAEQLGGFSKYGYFEYLEKEETEE